MKIQEMLIDAAKYPISGLKQLFLLGFLILIASLFLGDYSDFYIYLDNLLGDDGLLLVLFPFLIMAAILLILESGYSFKVIEKSIRGIEKPPQLNNFISMFKHGINELIIIFMYFIIPLILLLIFLDDALTELNLGLPVIDDNIAFSILIATFLFGFFAQMMFTVAIPHMASKGGSLKEAFRFKEMFKKIKEIGLTKMLVGYIIIIIGLVIIGGPILKEIIGSTNIFGFIIAEEVLAPYIIMFSGRFTALLYKG